MTLAATTFGQEKGLHKEKANTKTGKRSRKISGGHWGHQWATGSFCLKSTLSLHLTVTCTNEFFLLYQPFLVEVESTVGVRVLLNLDCLNFLFSNRFKYHSVKQVAKEETLVIVMFITFAVQQNHVEGF